MKRVRSFSSSSSGSASDDDNDDDERLQGYALVATEPCLPQVEAVFYSRDLLLTQLRPFLGERAFVRLICCDKRLYAMASDDHYAVLRECQLRYGGQRLVTDAWIKRCCKRRNLKALQWVLERTLREYLPLNHARSRLDDTSVALVAFARFGFKAAFANHWREGIDCMLQWYRKLQTVENPWIRHTFHYSGTDLTPLQVLPSAMMKVALCGHLTLVRHFLETEVPGLQFPNPPFQDEKLAEQEVRRFVRVLFVACLSHNDMANYGFFFDLFQKYYLAGSGDDLPNKNGRVYWADKMIRHVLEEGVSPGALPMLLRMVVYPSEWQIHEQLKCAVHNPNPAILKYLMATSRPDHLKGCTDMLKKEYLVLEDMLRSVVGTLTVDVHKKKVGKRVPMLQKRMEYLQRALTRAPFDVDWDEFRPKSQYASFFHDVRWGLAL